MGLSLSACGKNSDASTGAASSEADTTGSSVSTTAQAYKKSADDKEDTVKLLKDFLGKTLEDQNHVVTAAMDGKDVFTENVSGTSNHIKYSGQDFGCIASGLGGSKKEYAIPYPCPCRVCKNRTAFSLI